MPIDIRHDNLTLDFIAEKDLFCKKEKQLLKKGDYSLFIYQDRLIFFL